MLSLSNGAAAVSDYDHDHDDDESVMLMVVPRMMMDDTAPESSNAIALRHRGGYSLTKSSFMPIFFIIQLYTFLFQLQAGFWSTAGFREHATMLRASSALGKDRGYAPFSFLFFLLLMKFYVFFFFFLPHASFFLFFTQMVILDEIQFFAKLQTMT